MILEVKRDQLDDLNKEVLEIKDRHPKLSLDNAFVAWFLRAFIVNKESTAVEALKGGSKDKGVDALYIDHEVGAVFILQGKYHQVAKVVSESRSDVIALGDLGRVLLLNDRKGFDALLHDADPSARDALEMAHKVLQKGNYRLVLQFITTGKVSETHKEEATQRIEDWTNASFDVYSRDDLLRVMQDYIEGASPPVPSISVPIHGDQMFNRYDEITGISSWVFTVLGTDLAELYNDIGDRLFARNIRGYQGKTEVNRGILGTLENEPDYFWYFNNGVTIISDNARQITERQHKYLRVANAQIINGQQTVRSLSACSTSTATLLVRVIVVPREAAIGYERYSYLVNQIVKASNWQNAITQSDLMSNDIEQVRLERELWKLGYHYLRKRQTITEARRITGSRYRYFIKKEDLARSVGACLLDPYEVRLGRDRLFEDDVYSKLFDGRPAAEYLTYNWLSQIVSLYSRGDIRRSYAKWLVLNFTWLQIGKMLKRRELRENFRYIAERRARYEKQLKSLYNAVDSIFRAAMAFYRANRKTKDGILDESTFFRHKFLHREFLKYWRLSTNTRRNYVDKQFDSFIKYLHDVER